MPTSIHIPKPLLDLIDDRSRSLRISRNRLIVRALEREIQSMEWSPGFFDRLGAVDPETAAAVDDLLTAVRARRSSKRPRLL